MLRTLILAAATGSLLLGCTHGGAGGALSQDPTNAAQKQRLAAHAASIQYPTDAQASDELKVTAVVDRSDRTITLRNFGDSPLQNFDVWVNGAFVRHVASLPARAGLVIAYGQFFDTRGFSLAAQNPTITRVQLQAQNKLYNAMGPAYD